jgi:purine catabolism regulator
VRGPGSTTHYAELGPYQLLIELRGSPALARFRARTLAPLVEHDRRTNGELLRTLDAYLSVGCSPTAAAERLHLHRNGLLYRLQRIREILPVNLDDPERRLALHLALRIGDVLEAGAQVRRIA